MGMSIQTDEDAFAVMCVVLGIGHIRELVLMSDATIRERCADSAELGTLLVALKAETLRQATARVRASARGGVVHGGGVSSEDLRGDDLRCRLQKLRSI